VNLRPDVGLCDDASNNSKTDTARGLGEQVYDAVLDLIVSRQLRAGDKVPERNLAQKLAVSRTPLREALRRLEGEKVIERRDSGQLYVCEISVEDFMEVLQLRRLIESDAAARAARQIDPVALENLRLRLEQLLRDGDPSVPDHLATDEDLHRLVSEAAGNRLATEIIGDLRRRTRMFSMKRMPERFEAICTEHLAIVAALASGDAAAAARAVTDHLDAVRASIIQRLAAP
jgi:DNA-binding GntR family transcriptional regulator